MLSIRAAALTEESDQVGPEEARFVLYAQESD